MSDYEFSLQIFCKFVAMRMQVAPYAIIPSGQNLTPNANHLCIQFQVCHCKLICNKFLGVYAADRDGILPKGLKRLTIIQDGPIHIH